MSGPDLAIIFLIFLIAFSLDLALWRSILMVKQFNGARETSRKEADISTFSKYFILKRQRITVNFLLLVNVKIPNLKVLPPSGTFFLTKTHDRFSHHVFVVYKYILKSPLHTQSMDGKYHKVLPLLCLRVYVGGHHTSLSLHRFVCSHVHGSHLAWDH